jgi:outer membrane protein OmpA-like peptidoglycan-associated protein
MLGTREDFAMKRRIFWIGLLLAVTLTASAYAQQDTGNSTGQNPPASTQSNDQVAPQMGQNTNPAQPQATQSAAPEPGAHEPLEAQRHEGFWGHLNPMARKKYVQKQTDPIRDRVNELDELTAANGKSIKDVDARAQEGIRLASARANEADQHAIDATNRATLAGQTAQQANTRLQTVQQAVTNIDQYQPATQTEIRLRPGQTVLSKKAKDALDQMADSVKGQNAYLIEVQGFSTGAGAAGIESSQRMAQSVVRYLVANHDIPVYRIYLLGMGNAKAPSADGQPAHGSRVEISLLKNTNLEQLANSSAVPASTPGTAAQGGVSGTAAQPEQKKSESTPESNTQQPSSPQAK